MKSKQFIDCSDIYAFAAKTPHPQEVYDAIQRGLHENGFHYRISVDAWEYMPSREMRAHG